MGSLFSIGQQISTNPDQIRVVIDDVDVNNGVVHARDRTAAIIQIRFNEAPGGTLLIPEVGQTWTAVRRGYTWYLDQLVSTKDLSGYSPGTLIIDAPGGIILNDVPLRGSIIIQDRFFNPTSGFTSVTLSSNPIEASTIVPYINGIAVMPDFWTYNEETRVLTFDATVGEIGNLVVTYQIVPED